MKTWGQPLNNKTVGSKSVAFGSRFVILAETEYSNNDLELLGVVLSIQRFRFYLYGQQFFLVHDHKALLSILKHNPSNKTYKNRFTR